MSTLTQYRSSDLLVPTPSNVKCGTTVQNLPFFLSQHSSRGRMRRTSGHQKTEWHRVCVLRPRLADHVTTTIKKGADVLVEGTYIVWSYCMAALPTRTVCSLMNDGAIYD